MSLNNKVWTGGLASLAFLPTGNLFALAAPKGVWPYKLYTLDPGSGSLTRLRDLDVVTLTVTQA